MKRAQVSRFQSATSDPEVAFQKCEKSNNDGLGSGVAVQKRENGFCARDDELRASFLGLFEPGVDAVHPPVCVHCGRPDHPEERVQECTTEDGTFLLHEQCQEEWLDGPWHIPPMLQRS